MKSDDIERLNLLLDYYGELLTEHQKEVLKDYYQEDYSMVEIAENEQVSRAAISDLITRSSKQLETFESKLHLIEQKKKYDDLIDEMSLNNNEEVKKYASLLRKITQE